MNSIKLFLCSVCFMVVASACEKDDLPDTNDILVYRNIEYPVEECFLTYLGNENYAYLMSFDMYSEDFEQFGFDEDSIRLGKGYGFSFDLCTSSPLEVASGTYSYSNSIKPGVFYIGRILVFRDGQALYDGNEIVSGEVIVTRLEAGYKLEIEGLDQEGNPIEGTYEGTPVNRDWSW